MMSSLYITELFNIEFEDVKMLEHEDHDDEWSVLVTDLLEYELTRPKVEPGCIRLCRQLVSDQVLADRFIAHVESNLSVFEL